MFRKGKVLRSVLAVVFGLSLFIPCVPAFAQWRGPHEGGVRGGPHHEEVFVGHQRYNYHDGRFYRRGWFGMEVVLDFAPIGAIVTVLPDGHRVILAGGVTYYYYDNIYYTAAPGGYVVVSAPVIPAPAPVVVAPAPAAVVIPAAPVVAAPPAAQVPAAAGESVTLNVPNANGSYSTVTLVKRGDGYVGPQGEYYPGHPTIKQLEVLYGR